MSCSQEPLINCNININDNGKMLTVPGGDTLLSLLIAQKIFLPSACGGKGTCGTCKAKVTSDIGPYLPTEKPLLSTTELQENIRLACQIKVKNDVRIEIPEELFNIKQFKTKVESIKDVTYDIKELKLKLIEPVKITFKAGQYAQFIIPPYNKIKSMNQRAYSMSSKPNDSGMLEFLVRLVPGGIATTYVHSILQENHIFDLIAPIGDFFLNNSDADILCIAGGSGMAPIKSILFDMLDKNMLNRNAWYFFGARQLTDMFYAEMFSDLEKKWENFHFVPALSEPQPDDNWQGEVGLVTEVLENYLQNKIPQNTEKEAYLCGSPGMIDACIKVLHKYEIPDEKIFYDKFS